MTGKDIVLYLIRNDLLDKEFDATFPMCKSVDEVALACQCGPSTIKAACDLHLIDSVPMQIIENEKLTNYIRKLNGGSNAN